MAIRFASDAEREALLANLEANFATRRFTSASDAFDTVKAYIVERAAQRESEQGRKDG